MSVRWIGSRACVTCGRWGGHASWCAEVNAWLQRITEARAEATGGAVR